MFEADAGAAAEVARPAARTRAAVAAALAHPFWTLVGLRALFLVGTAGTLLWAPLSHGRMMRDHAYGGLSDLVFGAFDQLDSELFVHIAQHGYDGNWAPAFFPVFPLLLRGAHYVFGSYLVGGVLLSLVAGGLGAWALAEIVRPLLGERGARDSVLFLALFPTAAVFTAAYSDGVCFALSAAAFLAATRRRPWLCAFAAAGAVGTRTLALALLPALAYLLWPRGRPLRWRALWRPALPFVTGGLALGGYMAYLYVQRGDALAFEHAQSLWRRSVPALGPLGGLEIAVDEGLRSADLVIQHLPAMAAAPAGFDQNYQWAFLNAAHLLFFVVAAALTVVAWRRVGPAFGIYSVCTLVLILSDPPQGFPLQAMPRYLLADFPLVVALAALTARRPAARTWAIGVLSVLTTAGAIAFSRDIWLM